MATITLFASTNQLRPGGDGYVFTPVQGAESAWSLRAAECEVTVTFTNSSEIRNRQKIVGGRSPFSRAVFTWGVDDKLQPKMRLPNDFDCTCLDSAHLAAMSCAYKDDRRLQNRKSQEVPSSRKHQHDALREEQTFIGAIPSTCSGLVLQHGGKLS